MLKSCHQPQRAAILIANGYKEDFTISCSARMRQARLPVSLVAPTKHPVSGAHGIIVQPDYGLDEVYQQPCFRLIIIPGSRLAAATLLADPRTHTLIDNALQQGGVVATTNDTESLLAGLIKPRSQLATQFRPQQQMSSAEFIQTLLALMAQPLSEPA